MKIDKAAVVIVVLCIFIHVTGIGTDNYFYNNQTKKQSLFFLIIQGTGYLIYPLLGWLADVCFSRYKFVRGSLTLMIAGSVMLVLAVVGNVITHDQYLVLYAVMGLFLTVCILALGMFESTAIQFGMDQMLEASSNQLSTFIQWYYWASKLGFLLAYIMYTGITIYCSQCKINEFRDIHNVYFILFMGSTLAIVLCILQIICSIAGLCLLVYYKPCLNIDQVGSSPWKLVYRVLHYSWKHKCPERRSAFTYWEEDIPPRIDLGKSKYGGPFTTEEVEDTKTFLRILLLFLPLLGSQLSTSSYSVLNQLVKHGCPPYWLSMVTDPAAFSTLLIIIGIPVYQWFLLPRIHTRLPNMLKRIGCGLALCMMKEIIELIIKTTISTDCTTAVNGRLDDCYIVNSVRELNGTCIRLKYDTCSNILNHFNWLVIPSILHGLSLLLVFMTTLEFICAQAPLRMKGVLVAMWYASQSVSFLIIGIPEVFITSSKAWNIYLSIKIGLMFVLLVAYVCASKRYRYRLRYEVVNVQYLVEDVYDRELAERERLQETASINSATTTYESCENSYQH